MQVCSALYPTLSQAQLQHEHPPSCTGLAHPLKRQHVYRLFMCRLKSVTFLPIASPVPGLSCQPAHQHPALWLQQSLGSLRFCSQHTSLFAVLPTSCDEDSLFLHLTRNLLESKIISMLKSSSA